MVIASIYTDASYNEATGIGAVAFHARIRNRRFSGSLALSYLRKITGSKVDISRLEIFAVLFALRSLRNESYDGIKLHLDNVNIIFLFLPWREPRFKPDVMRTYRAVLRKIGGRSIVVTHVKAHAKRKNREQRIHEAVDQLARNKRRKHENQARTCHRVREETGDLDCERMG